MKILVIQTAFIGDVILATPLLESLYRHHPDWQIDLLVRKGNEQLLNNFLGIRKVYIWDKKNNKTRNLLRVLKEIRIEKYDEVINLQRFFSTGLLTVFSGAKVKTGFDKNPLAYFFDNIIKHEIGFNKKAHEVERNLLLIQHLQGDEFVRPILYPSPSDNNITSSYKLLPYYCLAPTSVWFTKQMPAEKWVQLIQETERINDQDFKIYLIGAATDKDICEMIIRDSGSKKCINLAGNFSLLQTASLMKDAIMNYVNDSAPMHIASAMNAPVTAFYCSTIPEFGFGPLSDIKKIIEIETKLNCRPCGLHGYRECPLGHFRCGKEIPVSKSVVKIHL